MRYIKKPSEVETHAAGSLVNQNWKLISN